MQEVTPLPNSKSRPKYLEGWVISSEESSRNVKNGILQDPPCHKVWGVARERSLVDYSKCCNQKLWKCKMLTSKAFLSKYSHSSWECIVRSHEGGTFPGGTDNLSKWKQTKLSRVYTYIRAYDKHSQCLEANKCQTIPWNFVITVLYQIGEFTQFRTSFILRRNLSNN